MPLTGTNLTNNSIDNQRVTSDFYATPANVTEALLDFLQLPLSTTIWEPACGDGAMSRVIEQRGYQVASTDLYDRGYGKGGMDYMASETALGEFMITNPPFSLAVDFINKSTALHLKGFALLLKSQFWHSKKRLELFRRTNPRFVLPLTWRPDFCFGQRGGAPTMDCLWTVWIADGSHLQTVYVPLEKPTVIQSVPVLPLFDTK